MNIAIEITCLLIEAADSSLELRVDNGHLKVRAGGRIDPDLRQCLKEHEVAIIERLNYDATHSDPFAGFIDQHCLFFAREGMATGITELDETYLQWAQHNDVVPSSVVLLHGRLRQLGCEEVYLQATPSWEHVGIWWPASGVPSDTESVVE